MEHPTCSMCGWTGPRHKMIRIGGDQADWPKLVRWGSPLHSKHTNWACRDEAACQERQAHRQETTAG